MRSLLRFGALVAGVAVSSTALATECISVAFPRTTRILGVADDARGAEPIDVPRNFAFFASVRVGEFAWTSRFDVVVDASDRTATLSPMPEVGEILALSQFTTVSDAGIVDGPALRVVDYVDEEPPSTPRITSTEVDPGSVSGCGGGNCASPPSRVLHIERSSDDFTSKTRMTYAIYVGASPEEAQNETRALEHRMLDDGSIDALSSDLTEGRYVAIEAIDQAGNRSARTAAVRVTGLSEDGCTTGRSNPRSGPVLLACTLAALALRRRKLARESRELVGSTRGSLL